MPRVDTESFLWRAAPRPHRVRLIGAITIALSAGALGVLVGRWSMERAPSEPGTPTAALIEAVAKETRAKLAVAPNEPAITALQQGSGPQPVAPAASSPPDSSSLATSSSDRVAIPQPDEAPAAAPAEERASASPPLPPPAALPRDAGRAERQRPGEVRSVMPEVRRPQLRRAPWQTTAPDYRALREYVLSR